MNILIVGISGFLGHSIGTYLVKNSLGQVYGATRQKDFDIRGCADVRIALDERGYSPLLSSQRFDVVINCAGVDSNYCSQGFSDFFMPNVDYALSLFEWVSSKRNPLFIFVSTVHVYDLQQSLKIDEDTDPSPTTYYGLSKYLGEEACSFFSRCHEKRLVILRLANVFARPNSGLNYLLERKGFVESICRDAVFHGRIVFKGDHNISRDFIDMTSVQQVVRYIVTNIQVRIEDKQVYNIASGQSLSLMEVALQVANRATEKLGKEVGIDYVRSTRAIQRVSIDSSLRDDHFLQIESLNEQHICEILDRLIEKREYEE